MGIKVSFFFFFLGVWLSNVSFFFFLEWIRNDLLENSLDSIFFFGIIVFKESEIKNLCKEIYRISVAKFKA